MWGFRVQKTDSQIKMISCDTVSSLFAKITSVLKAAICSVVCSFSEEAFTLQVKSVIVTYKREGKRERSNKRRSEKLYSID